MTWRFSAYAVLLAIPVACAPRTRPDLFECDGCDAIHEGVPSVLRDRMTIAGPEEPGERMVLEGRIVTADGRAPATGVVVYVHHTNAAGVYPSLPDDTGWARRHGYLRGWGLTNAQGRYRFETIRPGAYPRTSDPAHIHITIKEPGRREYWIDEVVFTDDPRVTPEYIRRQQRRGGSGVVTPSRSGDGTWHVQRDIRLEP